MTTVREVECRIAVRSMAAACRDAKTNDTVGPMLVQSLLFQLAAHKMRCAVGLTPEDMERLREQAAKIGKELTDEG